MSFLKDACELGKSATLPRRADHFELERVVRKIETAGTGGAKNKEVWADFLSRLDLEALELLKSRDLRRLVLELWEHQSLNNRAEPVLDESVGRTRKSIDLKIIAAYLKAFPVNHPAFNHLTQASLMVAGRHDWAWRHRSEKWQLFRPDTGPEHLSRALLDADDPFTVFQETGLDGDLSSGGFVERTVLAACRQAAKAPSGRGAEYGRRLIELTENFRGAGHLNAPLAYALLAPWKDSACTEAHQKLVTKVLVEKVGDPRLKPAAWAALESQVILIFPDENVGDVFAILRRWLVQATFREFFSVVAKTVERRDQWRERTEFWMAYLDAGLILDAWFAFGTTAERMARQLMEDKSVQYGRLDGTGATSHQSSLIFTLGSLRVGEWSDNGSCRFWTAADPGAPKLYERKYPAYKLRTMYGGDDFKAIPHNPPNGWQPKFARHIYRLTGIPHPKHGKGW